MHRTCTLHSERPDSDILICSYRDRYVRVRFFKKIQDWIPKPERISRLILRFFAKQINLRSSGSMYVKETKNPLPEWILVLPEWILQFLCLVGLLFGFKNAILDFL